MQNMVSHIAGLAELLDPQLQEKLWEFAELLYIEQTAFEDTDEAAMHIEALPNFW